MTYLSEGTAKFAKSSDTTRQIDVSSGHMKESCIVYFAFKTGNRKRGPNGFQNPSESDSFREAPCARTGDEVGGPFPRNAVQKKNMLRNDCRVYVNLVILNFILYVYID